MLKTQIELVTGFIGAGKTTWIELLLEETASKEEKIVVLQLEKGQRNLTLLPKQRADITYITNAEELLNTSYLNHLLILYEPDRLIIECNGMKRLDEIISLAEKPKIRERAVVSTLFNLVEAPSFRVYWQNLKSILGPALKASHMIIVTKTHLISKEEQVALRTLLEEENTHAHMLFAGDLTELKRAVKNCQLLDKGWFKDMRIKLVGIIKKIHRDREESQ